jgi:hypothetical protein
MITEALRDYVLNDVQHGLTAGTRSSGSKVDFHHTFLHDTKPNRKKFPFLIDSSFNLWVLPHLFHIANPSWKPFNLPEWLLVEIEASLKSFDEAVKTTEKTFEELFEPIDEKIEWKFAENEFFSENYKEFSDRLEAAFRWIWIKRR